MTDELWGVGADARHVARPVLLSIAAGSLAAAVSFCAALLLGRGVVGSAVTAFLVPLALSGALAIGLAVAFMAATVLAEPTGPARVGRLVSYLAPVAAAVAVVAYVGEITETPVRYATPAAAPAPGMRTAPPVLPVPLAVPGLPVVPAVPGVRTVATARGHRTAVDVAPATSGRWAPFAAPARRPVVQVRATIVPEVLVPEVSQAPEPVSLRRSASGRRGRHRGWGRSRRALRRRSCKGR